MIVLDRNRYCRRTFLRGLGVGLGMLPMLEPEREAQAAALPRRLVVVHFPNGIVPDEFWPTGTETDFQLGKILTPLEPWKSRLLVLGGVDMRSYEDQPSDDGSTSAGHEAEANVLTATRLAVFRIRNYQAGGLSIDQHIANGLSRQVPLPVHSLVVGAKAGGFVSLSWRGPSDPVSFENSPTRLFQRVFGTRALGGDEIQRLHARRRSVLDYLAGDLGRFARRLGGEDRRKVDAHLASVREIEAELSRIGSAPACAPPPAPGTVQDDFRVHLKVQSDIIVAALRCDVTRVVTFKWRDTSSYGVTFPWLGADFVAPGDEYRIRDHHDIAHNQRRSADHTRRKVLVDHWYYTQVAYLVQKMNEVQEGGRTLLDNSTVLVSNNMVDGDWHSNLGMPFVLVGSCGGYFKTGRWLKLGGWAPLSGNYHGPLSGRGRKGPPGVPHNALLVSLANAMGVPTETFGDPRYGSGELPRLRG